MWAVIIGVNDSKWSWIQILRTPKHWEWKHRSIRVSKHRFLLWHWTATQFNLQNTEYDSWRHQSDLHGHCGPPIPRIYGPNDQIQHCTASPPEPVALIFQCSLNQSCYVSWISVKGHKNVKVRQKPTELSFKSSRSVLYYLLFTHHSIIAYRNSLYKYIFVYTSLFKKASSDV